MSRPTLPACLALSALLTLATGAQATITVFTNQGSFLSAVQGAGVDRFDDLDPRDAYDGPLARSAGSLTYEVGADGGPLRGAGTRGNGWLAAAAAGDGLVFASFGAGVNAVGGRFFGSNAQGRFVPHATVTLTATDGAGSQSYTVVDARRNSFIGFVSDGPLQSLRVSTDPAAGAAWGTVNNLVLAAVPEPATTFTLLAGLLVVGWAARRRAA
jgi:hypothetical protein